MEFPKHVKWRDEKFGAVIFDTLSEKVYVTNETGRNILRMIEEGLEVSGFTERLLYGYAGDEAQVRGDVETFVTGLESAGLLLAA
jgi:hypothetical protein